MKNIQIPEPCSENWNKMTPTEKGAFCQKCALEVVDFTDKSADEIRSVLAQNIGNHACMRIKNTQLDELNDDFNAWRMNNPQSFNRAWVFTLLVVFGMSLFSCQEEEEPVIKQYQEMGQTILENEEEVAPQHSVDSSEITATTPKETLNSNKHSQQTPSEEVTILGETVLEECVVFEETVISAHMVEEKQVRHTAGVPMISRDYDDYLEEVTLGKVAVREVELITGVVYPNPASNQTTLKIQVPKRVKGQIEIFSQTGRRISTIYEGRFKKGETEFPIDVSDFEAGWYMIHVITEDQKETFKFSKI